MQNRLVVLFIAASSTDPKRLVQKVYRGAASSFADMWQKCAETLPDDLMRSDGSGVILVGREGDAWIKNPTPVAPAARSWYGTAKSGSVMEFLRQHTELYFPSTVTTSPAMAEAATA